MKMTIIYACEWAWAWTAKLQIFIRYINTSLWLHLDRIWINYEFESTNYTIEQQFNNPRFQAINYPFWKGRLQEMYL